MGVGRRSGVTAGLAVAGVLGSSNWKGMAAMGVMGDGPMPSGEVQNSGEVRLVVSGVSVWGWSSSGKRRRGSVGLDDVEALRSTSPGWSSSRGSLDSTLGVSGEVEMASVDERGPTVDDRAERADGVGDERLGLGVGDWLEEVLVVASEGERTTLSSYPSSLGEIEMAPPAVSNSSGSSANSLCSSYTSWSNSSMGSDVDAVEFEPRVIDNGGV